MTNPRLRILLVDEEHSRRMNIEKNLAGLGYSRVAPLSSLRELLVVIDNALSCFDLLIVNEVMFNGVDALFEERVRGCPRIKHLLVYRGAEVQLSAVDSSLSSIHFSLSCPPDRTSIKHVMDVVERA